MSQRRSKIRISLSAFSNFLKICIVIGKRLVFVQLNKWKKRNGARTRKNRKVKKELGKHGSRGFRKAKEDSQKENTLSISDLFPLKIS